MSELKTLLLTERITRLEQELTEARAENERLRKPVSIGCSYCGEIICTEAEWNAKVPDHMANCAKNPVNVLALENVRLKAPVTEEEWQAKRLELAGVKRRMESPSPIFVRITGAETFNALIADRAAGGKG